VYNYSITAADVDDASDTLMISASTIPTWLTLVDNGDGTANLTGTPTNGEVGTHSVVLAVNDGEAAPVTQSFTIYSYEITTDDVDTSDTLTITASTIPTWLTLVDIGNGAASLTGTPTNAEVGTYNVVLAVNDGEAAPVTQSFTITRTITAGTLPTWLTLTDNGDGTAILTGTPTNDELGTHTIVLEVDDGKAPKTIQTFSVIVINSNDAPLGLPLIIGTLTEGETLTADTNGISDDDGLGSFHYQWLRNDTEISGSTSSTYTLGVADVGTQISVIVTYTDAEGTSEGPLASDYTTFVIAANQSPIITSNGGATTALELVEENQRTILQVTSSDVDGTVRAYSLVGGIDQALFLIDANSGVLKFTRPMNFELPDDSDANNQYHVVIQVADEQGEIDTQDLTVTVTDVNESPVLISEEINGSVVDAGNGETAVSISVDENQIWIAQIPVKDADSGATQP